MRPGWAQRNLSQLQADRALHSQRRHTYATFTLLVVGMVAQTGPRTVWDAPGWVTARGNRRVIVGIVVRLPFQARPTCLPVLFRLWGGKGSATPVELARTLVGLLARAFPGPGHPRRWGHGLPWQAGAGVSWRQTSVTRYGRTDTVAVAEVACLWYGAFGNEAAGGPGPRPRWRRHSGAGTVTTDLTSAVEQIVTRYAGRWRVEVCQPQCTHTRAGCMIWAPVVGWWL